MTPRPPGPSLVPPPAPTGLAVRTIRLVHVYRTGGMDVAALSGVDLVVEAGEYVGLLGPSGSGKSTLLSLLGGIQRPTAGRVLLGGLDLTTASEAEVDDLRAGPVSLLLQGAARNLLGDRTARENVAFAQRRARALARPVPEVSEVLAEVGVADLADLPLARLDPGELQLVALAAAIASAPGLLLADEPTSQLDHEARDRVLDTLLRINRDLGTTILLVTHDPEVAGALPRTVTIRDGRIGGEGRRGEQYAVVTQDGSLPLPADLVDQLPPGTLVRFHPDGEGGYRVTRES